MGTECRRGAAIDDGDGHCILFTAEFRPAGRTGISGDVIWRCAFCRAALLIVRAPIKRRIRLYLGVSGGPAAQIAPFHSDARPG